jgi:phosphatidylserine/phosphatidylglycerophosphate/cardiolipin synthase-like enzyme
LILGASHGISPLQKEEEREMSCNSPFVIALSIAEERILVENTAKYIIPHYKVVRSEIILLAASGYDNQHIAQILDIPRRIVTKWRKRFYEEGLDGLKDRPRCGRPRSFSPSEHCGDQGHCLRTPR